MTGLLASWRRAVTAELCWLEPSGTPAALAVVPLVADGVPVVAVPYSHSDAVDGLRAAGRAVWAVTDSRSLPRGRPGRAAVGRVEVVDDVGGDVFAGELLDQELRKYPPARTLVDSPVLRREHWWFLPRILVRLVPTGSRELDLPARTNPRTHALLVREDGDGPALDVVALRGTADRLALTGLGGEPLRGDGARAAVFGYDYSLPDLERFETWSVRGTLLGDELLVASREGDPDTDLAPLSLLRRIARQRGLARACRRGIAAAEGRRRA